MVENKFEHAATSSTSRNEGAKFVFMRINTSASMMYYLVVFIPFPPKMLSELEFLCVSMICLNNF